MAASMPPSSSTTAAADDDDSSDDDIPIREYIRRSRERRRQTAAMSITIRSDRPTESAAENPERHERQTTLTQAVFSAVRRPRFVPANPGPEELEDLLLSDDDGDDDREEFIVGLMSRSEDQ